MEKKFKILYQKMMDDLKDGEMWIEGAKHAKKLDDPEIADYLLKSAKHRIMDCYPESRK